MIEPHLQASPQIMLANPASQQAQGLGLWLPMVEGGNSIFDLSKNQPALSATGTPVWELAPNGKRCINFSGTNYYSGIVPSIMNVQDNSLFTISFSMRTGQATFGTVLSTWNFSSGSGMAVRILQSPFTAGVVSLILSDNSGSNYRLAHTTSAYNDDKWHDVVIRRYGTSAASIDFTIDGISVNRVAPNDAAPGTLTNAVLRVGILSPSLMQGFVGNIRDLRFYNYLLTNENIRAMRSIQKREELWMKPYSGLPMKTPDYFDARYAAIWRSVSSISAITNYNGGLDIYKNVSSLEAKVKDSAKL